MFSILMTQQVIVSSSSLWIKKFSENIKINGEKTFFYLAMFFLSMTLPHLIGAISCISLEKCNINLYKSLILKFSNSFKNKINIYNNRKIKQRVESVITNEVSAFSRDCSQFIYAGFSSSLNVFCNVSAIAIFIDVQISFLFLLGLFLSTICLWMSASHISKSEIGAMDSRTEIQNSLLKFWDNNVIGNEIHLAIWKNKLNQRFTFWDRKEIKNSITHQFVYVCAVSLSIAPLALFFLIKLYYNYFTIEQLIVYSALFYRFFQVITSASFLYNILAQFSGYKSRFIEIKKVSDLSTSAGSIESKIDVNKVFYQLSKLNAKAPINDVRDFLAFLKCKENGRVYISGENGAGKSCLMLLLKDFLDANYLPPNHMLEFEGQESDQGSTGETQFWHIEQMLLQRQNTPLILDEWAANLDHTRRQQVDEKLTFISRERLIIEVAH